MKVPEVMKVGMYYNNRDVRVGSMPVPKIGNRDLLMKVKACAICGTDIMEWYRIKKAPMVQGHELTGDIVEIGKEVEGYNVGDRVFATHHVPCGECYDCKRGNGTLCEEFQKVNNFDPGGFSEYLRVTGRSVETGILRLPDNVTYEQGTFVEPLGSVVEGVTFQKGDTVLVLGSGIAGLLNIKFVRATAAGTIIATDLSDSRLEAARGFGADYTVNAREYSPDFVRQVNNGRLADVVIIAAASRAATEQALQSFDKGGRVIHFATPREGEKTGRDDYANWRTGLIETRTYGATPESCREALELIGSGTVRVDDMITHRLSLEEIREGFRVASSGEGLKVIIEPDRENAD
jgi:L-iditol 2-dehydrogenase